MLGWFSPRRRASAADVKAVLAARSGRESGPPEDHVEEASEKASESTVEGAPHEKDEVAEADLADVADSSAPVAARTGSGMSPKRLGKQPIRHDAMAQETPTSAAAAHGVSEAELAEYPEESVQLRVWLEMDPDEESFGVGLTDNNRVKSVDAGSPADRAGMMVWDLVSEVNDVPVSRGELVEAVAGRCVQVLPSLSAATSWTGL